MSDPVSFFSLDDSDFVGMWLFSSSSSSVLKIDQHSCVLPANAVSQLIIAIEDLIDSKSAFYSQVEFFSLFRFHMDVVQ